MQLQSLKSLILERNGEKDGFAERFGKVIPEGSLVLIEGKEGTDVWAAMSDAA